MQKCLAVYFETVLFVLALFTAETGSAKILYVDLNQTTSELEIVQAYGRNRGEAVVVLPLGERRDNFYQRGLQIQKKREQIRRLEQVLIQSYGCVRVDWRTLRCEATYERGAEFARIWSQREWLYQQYDEMPSRYHNSDLAEDLAALGNQEFSMVVFSGHHSPLRREFQGDIGWIEEDGLPQVFASLQRRDSVKSIFLLGCRSFRKSAIQNIWLKIFPNTRYFGGYINVGYDRNDVRGHEFLLRLLKLYWPGRESGPTAESFKTELRGFLTSVRYAWGSLLRPEAQNPIWIDSQPMD